MPLGRRLKNAYMIIKEEKKNYGELLLAGNHKMLGYLGNIKTPDIYYKGKKFYATGDIVFLDKKKCINFANKNKMFMN